MAKNVFLLLTVLGFLMAAFGVFLKFRVEERARPLLRKLDAAKPSQAALIFGAYVYPNGTPCLVLQDRLERGLELYQAGLVEKILLSGDHGLPDYDEVNAMRRYLERRGVPSEVLFCDYAGFDTYDSLLRARDIFRAESLILVTQSFHLKRALYIADSLGLEVQGVASDQREIPEIRSLKLRELAANFKAFIDLTRARPPVFLGEQIPLSQSVHRSHDL